MGKHEGDRWEFGHRLFKLGNPFGMFLQIDVKEHGKLVFLRERIDGIHLGAVQLRTFKAFQPVKQLNASGPLSDLVVKHVDSLGIFRPRCGEPINFPRILFGDLGKLLTVFSIPCVIGRMSRWKKDGFLNPELIHDLDILVHVAVHSIMFVHRDHRTLCFSGIGFSLSFGGRCSRLG